MKKPASLYDAALLLFLVVVLAAELQALDGLHLSVPPTAEKSPAPADILVVEGCVPVDTATTGRC